MNKTLWIFNEYAGSPYHGMTFRHYYLAKELVQRGYTVTIFSSSFSHVLKTYPSTKTQYNQECIDGINYVWIKMPKYENTKGVGRIRNWFLFGLKLLFVPYLKLQKPDFILVSSLPLIPIFPASLFAKRWNAKLIFEVRDIWPLSAIDLGGYSPRHPFIQLLQWTEDFAYRHAWKVISVLPNACDHMQKRGLNQNKFYYIPNGIETTMSLLNKPLLIYIEESLPKDKFIIGYTGALGVANALEYLIEAAKLLSERAQIHFVIVGDGSEKEKLLQQAYGLKNISFIPAISKAQIPELLKRFNICYIGWRNRKIYDYGVSANKLFDYMYSQKPILHSTNTKNDLVSLAQCGLCVEAENSEVIAKNILILFQMSEEERERLGQNGKNYVIANHSYGYLAKKLIGVLEDD